jgi:hypothetical protein
MIGSFHFLEVTVLTDLTMDIVQTGRIMVIAQINLIMEVSNLMIMLRERIVALLIAIIITRLHLILRKIQVRLFKRIRFKLNHRNKYRSQMLIII